MAMIRADQLQLIRSWLFEAGPLAYHRKRGGLEGWQPSKQTPFITLYPNLV